MNRKAIPKQRSPYLLFFQLVVKASLPLPTSSLFSLNFCLSTFMSPQFLPTVAIDVLLVTLTIFFLLILYESLLFLLVSLFYSLLLSYKSFFVRIRCYSSVVTGHQPQTVANNSTYKPYEASFSLDVNVCSTVFLWIRDAFENGRHCIQYN